MTAGAEEEGAVGLLELGTLDRPACPAPNFQVKLPSVGKEKRRVEAEGLGPVLILSRRKKPTTEQMNR